MQRNMTAIKSKSIGIACRRLPARASIAARALPGAHGEASSEKWPWCWYSNGMRKVKRKLATSLDAGKLLLLLVMMPCYLSRLAGVVDISAMLRDARRWRRLSLRRRAGGLVGACNSPMLNAPGAGARPSTTAAYAAAAVHLAMPPAWRRQLLRVRRDKIVSPRKQYRGTCSSGRWPPPQSGRRMSARIGRRWPVLSRRA